jgi:hypothetical protein
MTKRWIAIAVAALMLPLVACNQEDIATGNAPVGLIVSNKQNLTKIDLLGGPGCDTQAGTINLESFIKNPNAIGGNEPSAPRNPELNNIRITRYRVSYQRVDGGTLVPAPFVRSIDIILSPGGSSNDNLFTIFQADALSQAPFAALISGSGRDPETNRPVITMDVIVEVFGATLAGENVTGTTRFPLEFCANCGGCS